MSRTALIFLDTETTGLRPDVHAPWELAFITAVHDTEAGTLREVARFQGFINLTDDQMRNADPIALRVGGFHERYERTESNHPSAVVELLRAEIDACRMATRTAEVMGDDGHLLGLPPIHLVGAIPSFDHAMICSNWTGWPGFGEGLWHYHLIDIEALAVGAIVGYLDADDNAFVWPLKSKDISKWFDVIQPSEDEHTAMGDALHVERLYARIYGLEICA